MNELLTLLKVQVKEKFKLSIEWIRSEKFSYFILIAIVFYIIVGSFFSLSIQHDLYRGVRIWEFSAYTFTFLYTFWFWLISINGRKILLDISMKKPLIGLFTFAPVLLLLLTVTIFHYLLIWKSNILHEFFITFSVNITLLLIVLAYLSFFIINRQIRKYSQNSYLVKELKNTFEYIDKPTLYIFCALFFYSIYVSCTEYIHSMEIFFSGAIAFELLLSGFVWTKTDIA